MDIATPLRYPGGKGKLFYLFQAIISQTCKYKVNYAEPYAGGAGLALSLLYAGTVSSLHVNDINRSIYAFWYSVLYDTENFIKVIHDIPVSIEEWEKQREIQKHKNDVTLLELGLSTFFLNRTNRSGILKGGMIGGRKQEGKWTLEARFNKENLIKRIISIAEKKDSIHISNKDACDFLTDMETQKIRNLFYYLDPPYIKMGSGLYENFYTEEDHRAVAKRVAKLKAKWIVSYDEHDLATELYGKYNRMSYSLNYSAQEKRQGREFMAFSPRISIPDEIVRAKPEDKIFNISNITFTPAL